MGKRKASPSKLNLNKRQALSWNIQEVCNEAVPHDPTELELILRQCLFIIPLSEVTTVKRDKCAALLGEIQLSHLEYVNHFIDPVKKQRLTCLYLNDEPSPSILVIPSEEGKVDYIKVKYEFPYLAFRALAGPTKRWFHTIYQFNELDNVTLKIYLKHSAFIKLEYPCEITRQCKGNNDVFRLMNALYDVNANCNGPNYSESDKIAKAYELVSDDRAKVIENKYFHYKCCYSQPDNQPKNDEVAKCTCRTLSKLKPTLRQYQIEAVNWMLFMEKQYEDKNALDELHFLYKEIISRDGVKFFFNFIAGFFVEEKPLKTRKMSGGILADEMGLGKTIETVACILSNPRPSSSCIPFSLSEHDQIEEKDNENAFDSTEHLTNSDGSLSDDSDKSYVATEEFSSEEDFHTAQDTFECICGKNYRKNFTEVKCASCDVLQHAQCVHFTSSNGSNYLCPHCCISKVIRSRATFIVSPSAISGQWFEELNKHVVEGTFKIFVYTGVSKMGFIQPTDLADNDIILCTYETLRKELDYTELPHSKSNSGRKLRHPKRFMTIPSPLVCIEFWRICVDEAQMIEGTTTKTAEMVLKLSTLNRWCITGTPIQRSLDDLYGLVLFLGIDPVCAEVYWRKLISLPFLYGHLDPLVSLLKDIMWRSTKNAVIQQINIPEQKEMENWLTFSPVEQHFYRQQHVALSSTALRQIAKRDHLNVKLSLLDKKYVHMLMGSLRALRQACCHPQVVRGQFIPIQKSVITMEEILKALIKKTNLAAEDAHRDLIATYNGLAGINILQQDYPSAIKTYRTVLLSIDEHKDRLKTDKLQQIHALHNLAEIIEMLGEDIHQIGRTARDGSLKAEAAILRTTYLEKIVNQIKQSKNTLHQFQNDIKELNDVLNPTGGSPWWNSVLNDITLSKDSGMDFIRKLKDDQTLSKHSDKFHSIAGLQYVTIVGLDDLEAAHSKLVSAVCSLSDEPGLDMVNKAVDCHLRPTPNTTAQKCPYCDIYALFNNLEDLLFQIEEKNSCDEEPSTSENPCTLYQTQRRGTWADGNLEIIIKFIASYCKSSISDEELIEQGTYHLKRFDAFKKEFRALRSVWMKTMDLISAIDELNMATTRMRFKYPDEPESMTLLKNVLEPSKLDYYVIKLKSDEMVYQSQLKKKLGQLFYLKNLENSGKDEANPDPCPICQKNFGYQWAVLQCGHCFCLVCIEILIRDYSVCFSREKYINCAICRLKTNHSEISYVVSSAKESKNLEEIPVKGSYSTKIEAIIRCVLKIQLDDPCAKMLIFSNWSDVLSILSNALEQNEIKFAVLQSGRARHEKALSLFKTDADVKVLLLPINSGAKGLNLINATHVILVEPILNPGTEKQAVGRVHRIGQTEKTYVHKFFVKSTIEQNIHTMLQNSTEEKVNKLSEDEVITLRDLKSLFMNEEL